MASKHFLASERIKALEDTRADQLRRGDRETATITAIRIREAWKKFWATPPPTQKEREEDAEEVRENRRNDEEFYRNYIK